MLYNNLVATADGVAAVDSSSTRSAIEALHPAGPEDSEAAAPLATKPVDSMAQAISSEAVATPQKERLPVPAVASAGSLATQADQV